MSNKRLTCLVAATVSLSILVLAAGFPTFEAKKPLSLEPGSIAGLGHQERPPVTIAAGDFNGDGKPDMVVGTAFNNESANDLTFYPGHGDGTFGSPVVKKLNARPQEIAMADLNHDGISDIALITHPQTHGEPSRLWIFRGNRDGRLDAQTPAPLRAEASHVFVTDFDADGALDVGVSISGGFMIFAGHGDGTLSNPIAIPGIILSIADFNGDGKPDLLTLATPNLIGPSELAVRINAGHLTFSPPSKPFQAGPDGGFKAAIAADVNGDKKVDLMYVSSHRISIYLGKGDATFSPGADLQVPPSAEINPVRTADLNGDGYPDIIAAVWERIACKLLIFPGSGKGQFGPAITMKSEYTPTDIAIDDFNHDRKLDFAVSSAGAQSVTPFLQH